MYFNWSLICRSILLPIQRLLNFWNYQDHQPKVNENQSNEKTGSQAKAHTKIRRSSKSGFPISKSPIFTYTKSPIFFFSPRTTPATISNFSSKSFFRTPKLRLRGARARDSIHHRPRAHPLARCAQTDSGGHVPLCARTSPAGHITYVLPRAPR